MGEQMKKKKAVREQSLVLYILCSPFCHLCRWLQLTSSFFPQTHTTWSTYLLRSFHHPLSCLALDPTFHQNPFYHPPYIFFIYPSFKFFFLLKNFSIFLLFFIFIFHYLSFLYTARTLFCWKICQLASYLVLKTVSYCLWIDILEEKILSIKKNEEPEWRKNVWGWS